MLGFVLALHQLMVWLIVLAGLASVALGGAWLLLRRNATANSTTASAAAPAPSATTESVRQYFRYALIVTAALGVLQAIFGALLLLMGQRPADSLHYVYGLIVLLAIPVAYAYSGEAPTGTSAQGRFAHIRREVIILTIAALAVAAAAIRAWMTGAGAGH